MPSKRAKGDGGDRVWDVAIIGAGLAGLYCHYRLRKLGMTIRGFEAASDVGGTWWWNRYPGARCDVESVDYSYSFSRELLEEWTWSERFATQPEILRYVNRVADKFDLRRDIAFGTRITAAAFDDVANRWSLETDAGEQVTARFVIAAMGCLSAPILPEITDVGQFRGRIVQTSAWPREGVELEGKRVGVIGTGSSGIQAIPVIAREAARLTVFQRTPNFSLPARNGPIDRALQGRVKSDPVGYCRSNRHTPAGFQSHVPEHMPASWTPGRSALAANSDEHREVLDFLWDQGGTSFTSAYVDFTTNLDANQIAVDFVHRKIREIVTDPLVAELLCPADHPFATKRLCLDTDYYATFNRENVTLVDLRATPIERLTPSGLRTVEKEYPLDVLVFATGFDAVSGPLIQLNPTGRGGIELQHEWADGPRNYLGLMMAGFPNFFTVTGPGSPSVLTNMAVAIEQHVEWITACLQHMAVKGLDRIEADREAQESWAGEVRAAAAHSLFLKANSWYMGANVEGKPRQMLAYMGGLDQYGRRCEEVARNDYQGFCLSQASSRIPSAQDQFGGLAS